MNYYLVYWYDAEDKRLNGTSLIYAESKRAAHNIVRNALTPPTVTTMVTGHAELLTLKLEEELDISEHDKAIASYQGYTHIEWGT